MNDTANSKPIKLTKIANGTKVTKATKTLDLKSPNKNDDKMCNKV